MELNREIATLDIANFAEPLSKGVENILAQVRRIGS
jgi:hypothetical protein